ncbi:MAG: ArsR family transcriptional regulator [Thaumarchaeota archaeon]|nr:MAG: ArsR family transcriptional regulator [Nitrososphaerota archaeon]TLX94857.1 MAG: ArsR family transcriptional regulator [Nitrososphaerota archaeon]
MTRGYNTEEIREKLIDVLSESKTGLTGMEIAEKLQVNRVTMSKYLKIFSLEGLIKQKNIGSVNLWFIEEGVAQLNFPADFFKVKNKYTEYVLSASNHEANNLIRTSLHSGANPAKLVNEVIIPAIDAIESAYNNGKIGKSEKNFLDGIISTSVSLITFSSEEINHKKNIVILATDYQNSLLGRAASAAFHAEKWKVSLLGDMSSAIDVLFDIDLQRFLNRVWPKRDGIMIIVIFSSTEGAIKFFSQAVDASKTKSGKNLHLALCTRITKKTKPTADFVSDNVETLLQWCQTIFESSGNQ